MFNFGSGWPLVFVLARRGDQDKIEITHASKFLALGVAGVHWQLQLQNHNLSSTLDTDDTSQLPLDLFIYLPLYLVGVRHGFNG